MKILAFFFLSFPLIAQIVVTPSQVGVQEGGSVTLTSNYSNTTWTLAPGNVGTLSTAGPSASTVYTPPASITSKHNVYGCEVLPPDTVFNAPVNNLPNDPNNTALINNLTNYKFTFSSSNWGQSYADASTPLKTFDVYYGANILSNFPYPSGTNLHRQGGNYSGFFAFVGGADRHTFITRVSDCTFYDVYGDYLNGTTHYCQPGATGPATSCNAQSADYYSSKSYWMGHGGTVAGGIPLGLLWNVREIEQNAIGHVTLMNLNGGEILAGAVRWPATATAGGCAPGTCPNALPMGARIALNAGFNMSSICTGGTTIVYTYCTTILTGLQNYGAMLMDTGSTNEFELDKDVDTDPDVMNAVNMISQSGLLLPSSFHVVDESMLQMQLSGLGTYPSTGSYEVCPYSTTCGFATGSNTANTYVTPNAQAIVSASVTGQTTVTTSIPLQAAAINVDTGSFMAVVTGSYTWQIPFEVRNATNQNVTWTVTSGGGSVTTGGLYTPPANNLTYTSANIHGVAAADSNVTYDIKVKLLPPGANPVGSVRVAPGQPAATSGAAAADGGAYIDPISNNEWMPNFGWDVAVSFNGTEYPTWSQTTLANLLSYESSAYSYLGDVGFHHLVLPNGNYKIHYMAGYPANNNCNTVCSSWPGLSGYSANVFGPWIIESQGKQVGFNNFFSLNGYLFRQPVDYYFPATVTNNTLSFYIRPVSNDYMTPGLYTDNGSGTIYNGANPLAYAPGSGTDPDYIVMGSQQPYSQTKEAVVGGLEIVPDSTAAHWTIDTGGQTSISAGQTLNPFFVVDWYANDSLATSPTWTISGVPGATISSSGALSLPAGSYQSTKIRVTATGATQSAYVDIDVQGNALAVNQAPIVSHYSMARAITIPSTGAALTNFPVVVTITDATLATAANGGNVQNSSGYDIIFSSSTSPSGKLNWELDSPYNPVTGSVTAHVQIPTTSATASTTIYMLYDNPAITTAQNTPSSTWDTYFTEVLHMSSDTSGVTLDSTANAYNATEFNSGSPTATGIGIIGTGLGSFSSLAYNAVPAAAISATSGTIESWIYSTEALSGNTEGVFTSTGGTNQLWFGFEHNYDAPTSFENGWTAGVLRAGLTSANPPYVTINPNTWYHLAYTYSSSGQAMYLNGLLVQSTSTAPTTNAPTSAGSLGLIQGYNWNGYLDEFRISNTARSAAWIAADYAAQNSPSTFAVVGSQMAN